MKGADVKTFRKSLPEPHNKVDGFGKMLGRSRQSVWEYEKEPPGIIRALVTFAELAREHAPHSEFVATLESLRNGS